jgi:hypothetical protein
MPLGTLPGTAEGLNEGDANYGFSDHKNYQIESKKVA